MTGQVWVTNSLGGLMYSDELSDVLRCAVQPLVKLRQFCDAKDATEKGLHAGENYHWNVVPILRSLNLAICGKLLKPLDTIYVRIRGMTQ